MKNGHVFQESPGQFEELEEEYLTFSTTARLPSQRQPAAKEAKRGKKQKSKLKIINQQGKDNVSGIFSKYSSRGKKMAASGQTIKIGNATFRSNFQSGNLHSVARLQSDTFEIRLNKQSNSARNSSWFYFAVEGLKGDNRFIIKGFTKATSLYTQGMKICVRESQEARWRRGGSKISYQQSQSSEGAQYHELTFCYFFRSASKNVVEFAYCYPYPYSQLVDLMLSSSKLLHIQSIGQTYYSRELPMVTIGNDSSLYAIVVMARAHPGQTVGSFIMEGLIKQLTGSSKQSQMLKISFLFVLFPMINPDGVTNGNYRFSGAGFDLNRKWKHCNPRMEPEVYWIQKKIRQIAQTKRILMVLDLHGHSRQKNLFFYGCINKNANLQSEQRNNKPKQFPYLMSKIDPNFSFARSCYSMPRDKEGTARLSLWNQLSSDYIYTLQASLCGPEGVTNYTIGDYLKFGAQLCQGFYLHFWTFVKQMNVSTIKEEEIAKMDQRIKSSISQLYQNPLIDQFEGEGKSSDSEPEAGQISQEQRTKQVKTTPLQKLYKASRLFKVSTKPNTNLDTISKYEIRLRMPTQQRQIGECPDRPTNLQGPSQPRQRRRSERCKISQSQQQVYVRASLPGGPFHELLKIQSQQKHLNEKILTFPHKLQAKSTLSKHSPTKNNGNPHEGAQFYRVKMLAEQQNKNFLSIGESQIFRSSESIYNAMPSRFSFSQLETGASENAKLRGSSNRNHEVSSRLKSLSIDMHNCKRIKFKGSNSNRYYLNGIGQEISCFLKKT